MVRKPAVPNAKISPTPLKVLGVQHLLLLQPGTTAWKRNIPEPRECFAKPGSCHRTPHSSGDHSPGSTLLRFSLSFSSTSDFQQLLPWFAQHVSLHLTVTIEAYYELRDTEDVSPTAEVTQVPENIHHLKDFSVWWITEYYTDWQTLEQILTFLPTQEVC